MRAVQFNQFGGPVSIETLPDPTPSPDGVVVKVEATGLCRSDWHGWMGHDSDITLPHVPGHELAGTVAATGRDVQNWQVGDRVTMPFVCACGRCPECASGNHQVCDFQFQPGFTHWGSFAELVAIDHADVNLVRLPEEMSFVTAATLGCRFVTSFRAVVDQGQLSAGQWIAVHGCGGVGLSAIMIANALGANVIAVDIDDEKVELAKSLGALVGINANASADVVAEIKELTSGGAHVSVDALGSAITCFNSVSNLRKRGKHIQVGLMTGDHAHAAVPMDRIVAHELEILGSHGMQAFRYPAMLDMIRTGELEPQKLVQRTISLDMAPAELVRMDEFAGLGVTVIDQF